MNRARKPKHRAKKGPPLLPLAPINMDSVFGPGLVQKVSDSSALARTLLRCVTENAGKALGNRTLLAAAVGGLLGLPETRNIDALSAEWSSPETGLAPEVAQEGARISVRFTSRRHQPPAQGLVTLLNNAVGAVLWRLQNQTSPNLNELQTYWPEMPEPERRTLDLRPGAQWARELATAEIHCRVGDLEVMGDLAAVVSQPHVVVEIAIAQAWWSTPEAEQRFRTIWNDPQPLAIVITDALKPLLRYLADILGWATVDGTTPTVHSFDVLTDAVAHAWQVADDAERAANRASGDLKVAEKKLRDAGALNTQMAAQQRAASERIAYLEESLTKAGRHANVLEGKLLAAARQAQDAAPTDQAKDLQHQIDQLRKQRDDLAVSNDALRQDLHALQQRLAPPQELGADVPEPVVDPDDYAQLPAWIADNFKGRLVLTRKAAKAAVASIYHDPTVVFAALRAMAEHLHPVLAGERPGEMPAYEAALTAACCEDSAVGEAINDSRYVSDYMTTNAGRPLVLDRHVKRGSTFDPRTCMRIYYAWDARKRVIVIGHLTAHLTNRAT